MGQHYRTESLLDSESISNSVSHPQSSPESPDLGPQEAIYGEVYRVSPRMLEVLDDLEGVKEGRYTRSTISIRVPPENQSSESLNLSPEKPAESPESESEGPGKNFNSINLI